MNVWQLLPWEALSLAAIVAIALVVAEPGRCRAFIGAGVAAWGLTFLVIVLLSSVLGRGPLA